MMGFDPFLTRERSEELRREAQARHLQKRLRTNREHHPVVKRVTTLLVGGEEQNTTKEKVHAAYR